MERCAGRGCVALLHAAPERVCLPSSTNLTASPPFLPCRLALAACPCQPPSSPPPSRQVERLTTFVDAACTIPHASLELFERRRDGLERRLVRPAQRSTLSSYGPGATANLKALHLKAWVHSSGSNASSGTSSSRGGSARDGNGEAEAEAEMIFWHEARADGLMRQVRCSCCIYKDVLKCSACASFTSAPLAARSHWTRLLLCRRHLCGGVVQEWYAPGRPDHLIQRTVEYAEDVGAGTGRQQEQLGAHTTGVGADNGDVDGQESLSSRPRPRAAGAFAAFAAWGSAGREVARICEQHNGAPAAAAAAGLVERVFDLSRGEVRLVLLAEDMLNPLQQQREEEELAAAAASAATATATSVMNGDGDKRQRGAASPVADGGGLGGRVTLVLSLDGLLPEQAGAQNSSSPSSAQHAQQQRRELTAHRAACRAAQAEVRAAEEESRAILQQQQYQEQGSVLVTPYYDAPRVKVGRGFGEVSGGLRGRTVVVGQAARWLCASLAAPRSCASGPMMHCLPAGGGKRRRICSCRRQRCLRLPAAFLAEDWCAAS